MKPKVAFYWCASCGGCEEAVLDLDEELLDVARRVDIVFWPVALDFKEKDVEAHAGRLHPAISFINGAVRTTAPVEDGATSAAEVEAGGGFRRLCAIGRHPGLANLTDAQGILEKPTDGPSRRGRSHRENGTP